MVKIAVLGYGTVGGGVVDLIHINADEIAKHLGEEVQLGYILDLRTFPNDPYESYIVSDFEKIISDQDVKIVCEALGGTEPAYSFTKRLLQQGVSVCTSNKELVANHGPELLEIASNHKCNYMFEASVGGGIPIIRPMQSSLAQEKIVSITGILNGTTNFILTKMERENSDFNVVLKEAQDVGYAELNPEADVEGHDACRKIAILSSLAYGKTVDFAEIETKGITKISQIDFEYAKQFGMTIKLLATSKMVEDKCFAAVAPCMIAKNHPLYGVNEVFNAVLVKGNMVGNTMYYGPGAGKYPTASAIVADVLDCARHLGIAVKTSWSKEKQELASNAEACSKYFVRVESGEKELVQELFGELNASCEIIADEFGFITNEVSQAQLNTYVAKLQSVRSVLRMEEA